MAGVPATNFAPSFSPSFTGGAGGAAYGAPSTSVSGNVTFGDSGSAMFWLALAAIAVGVLWYRKK